MSKGSLNENTRPYIGIAVRSGLRPYRASKSGCVLFEGVRQLGGTFSQTGGAPGGSGPRGRAPVEVAPAGDRALAANVERRERVQPAPRSAMPAMIIPNCCCTPGSEAVASMRPNSSGRPLVPLQVGQDAGRLDEFRVGSAAATSARTDARRRREPGAPSSVTSALATPLKARDPLDAAGWTTATQVVRPTLDRLRAAPRSSPPPSETARPVRWARPSRRCLPWYEPHVSGAACGLINHNMPSSARP